MIFPFRPLLFALAVMFCMASPLSVFGATADVSETPTPWIHPPTRTLTSIPGFTATNTATSSPTATGKPSPSSEPVATETATPTMATLPAGRNLTRVIGTQTPTMTPTPLTLPDGCKFYSLLAEVDKDYTVLTFRCPNGTMVPTATGGTY